MGPPYTIPAGDVYHTSLRGMSITDIHFDFMCCIDGAEKKKPSQRIFVLYGIISFVVIPVVTSSLERRRSQSSLSTYCGRSIT